MDKLALAFRDLNDELTQLNQHLTVICVGGFVLQHHGLRATIDVDAFYETNRQIDQAIARVGQKHALNTYEELWLNNAVATLNPQPPLEICRPLFHFDHLEVLLPPIEYILGMKMVSNRGQDLLDIGHIIKYREITSPFDLYAQLKSYGFREIELDLLLEGFSLAYGLAWLEDFFIRHQDQLADYL